VSTNRSGLSLPALEPVYAVFRDAAEELLALPGALQAELWASQQLGVLDSAAPHALGHRTALSDLVQYLLDTATPSAALFLRCCAAIGPAWLRRGAARAAAEIGPAGLPGWAEELGRVEAADCWLVQDGSLGGDQVGCEFRYSGGTDGHAVLVTFEQDRPVGALVIGDMRGMREQLEKAVAAEECVLLRLAPAVAGRRLTVAYDGELPEALVPTAALVRQRLSVLTG
jgi:hypothetical protein